MLNGSADHEIDAFDWAGKIRLLQSSTIEHLDDYVSNISSLFQRPSLSDLTLVIENQDVRVNRSILAARSDYFHALLFNGMKESNSSRIELPTVHLESFNLILKFIYSGKLQLSNLNSEDLILLLESARFFCLEKLVCDIAIYLRFRINKVNVWMLHKISKLHYIDHLVKACERFFDKNAESILQQEEFSNLDVEELKEMVSRDSFYAPEKAILRAICVYYGNNICGKTPSQCVKLLKDILEPVRLSLLNVQEISNIFEEFKLPTCDPALEESLISCGQLELPDEKVQPFFGKPDHRSSFPIYDSSMNTKRLANLRVSPISRKKYKLAHPVLTVAFENQGNIPNRKCNEIEELQYSLEKHNCSFTTTSRPRYFTTLQLLEMISVLRQRKESIRGYLVYNKNIATKEYKVEPIKGRLKKDLVCSMDRNYNLRTCTNHTMHYPGVVSAAAPPREEYIQVAFGRPFIVNNIRMLLLDDGQRSFSYVVEVSVDGRNWSRIVDYSNYWCRSWQHLFFKERVVKHVRITGTRSLHYGAFSSQMCVVYFDCMYNKTDFSMFALTDDGTRSGKAKKTYIIEPKSSVIDISNTISSTMSSTGNMRQFRLQTQGKSSNATTNPNIPTSPNPHLSTGLLPSTEQSSGRNGTQTNHSSSSQMIHPSILRITDFTRGSANWNCSGKVIFQLAQPFKIGSFAFKIVPTGGSTRSHLSFSVSVSNDWDRSSWKLLNGNVTKIGGKDSTVIEFEAQVVTFIEIRPNDPSLSSNFTVKHFECPYIPEQQQS